MGHRSAPEFAIIGNPENRRVMLFQAALASQGLQPARVIPYLDLLAGGPAGQGARAAVRERTAAALAELPPDTVLRIDSPGENPAVARELLVLGAGEPAEPEPDHDHDRPARARIPASAARQATYQAGRIFYPGQQFAGYRALLDELQAALATRPDVRVMNAPRAIATLFDKAALRARAAARGVHMAPGLSPPAGPIHGYHDLRRRMRDAAMERVFIKLRHGSSASGVVAYQAGARGERAITSTHLRRRGDHIELYNSLALRTYQRRRDTIALIDALAREGVVVEAWIHKAALGPARCDLRIVTIAGRARHAVVRCSRSPLTNLHLGNQRASVADLCAHLGEAPWHAARELAEAAAACVPDALYAGVDVMIEASTLRPYLIEMNAFGDLLPGVLDGDGLDTYAAEVRACLGLCIASDPWTSRRALAASPW